MASPAHLPPLAHPPTLAAWTISPPFDAHDVFGDDYLHFYADMLTGERTAREADAIWKLLALAPGHDVLDLGCGHGRIANAVAARGARVTGLDASQHFLAVARRDAAAAGVAVDYREGDMRALSWQGAFDAALVWFTTFGYFSDADNERVVRAAAKALKPGGRFLIEQINRNALLRRGLPSTQVVRRGDDLMIDLLDYDGLADHSLTERIVVRGGEVKRAKFFVRHYSPAELTALLTRCGFRSVDIHGQDGEPFTLYGNRVIAVASLWELRRRATNFRCGAAPSCLFPKWISARGKH
jgi:SAM-dependent methyltransferase